MSTRISQMITTAPCVVVLLILQAQGCATRNDLAKLKDSLASEVKMARHEAQALRGRVETVQRQAKQESSTATNFEERIRTVETKHEVMRDEVLRQLGPMKQAIENMMARHALEMETFRTELSDVRKRVVEAQQDRVALTTAVQRLHTLSRTLLRRYQLEMDGLRGHLREMEQLAKDLEPFADNSGKNK
jgi:chromosome segregation ATPase